MIDGPAFRLSHGELAGMATANNRAVFPADRFMYCTPSENRSCTAPNRKNRLVLEGEYMAYFI